MSKNCPILFAFAAIGNGQGVSPIFQDDDGWYRFYVKFNKDKVGVSREFGHYENAELNRNQCVATGDTSNLEIVRYVSLYGHERN